MEGGVFVDLQFLLKPRVVFVRKPVYQIIALWSSDFLLWVKLVHLKKNEIISFCFVLKTNNRNKNKYPRLCLPSVMKWGAYTILQSDAIQWLETFFCMLLKSTAAWFDPEIISLTWRPVAFTLRETSAQRIHTLFLILINHLANLF